MCRGESESATRFQLRYVILVGVCLAKHWEGRTHPEVDPKFLQCWWLRVSAIHSEARLVQVKVSSGATTEQQISH